MTERDAPSIYTERDQRIFSQAEAKARALRASLIRCERCGGTMIPWPDGRTTHYVCDETTVAGKPCTCRGTCSQRVYGDGPDRCDPECVPCRIRLGKQLPRGQK